MDFFLIAKFLAFLLSTEILAPMPAVVLQRVNYKSQDYTFGVTFRLLRSMGQHRVKLKTALHFFTFQV